MGDDNKAEQWKVLCRQAENEKDSRKLMELIAEIDKELERRDLQKAQPKSFPSAR